MNKYPCYLADVEPSFGSVGIDQSRLLPRISLSAWLACPSNISWFVSLKLALVVFPPVILLWHARVSVAHKVLLQFTIFITTMAPESPEPLKSLPDCVELLLDDEEDGDGILEGDVGWDDGGPRQAPCPGKDRCSPSNSLPSS